MPEALATMTACPPTSAPESLAHSLVRLTNAASLVVACFLIFGELVRHHLIELWGILLCLLERAG